MPNTALTAPLDSSVTVEIKFLRNVLQEPMLQKELQPVQTVLKDLCATLAQRLPPKLILSALPVFIVHRQLSLRHNHWPLQADIAQTEASIKIANVLGAR